MSKELKALEIIKEKRVDVWLLFECDSIVEYNQNTHSCCLNQEEYDLLKEVLVYA